MPLGLSANLRQDAGVFQHRVQNPVARGPRLPRAWLFSVLVAGVLGLEIPGSLARADEPIPVPPAPARPGVQSDPTRVSVGAWIGDILAIDSAAQTFTANMVLILRWRDERLVRDGSDVRTFALEDIWHPRWLIVNESGSVERSLPETADVAADGSVVYRQRLVGSFSQSLDLRSFPFDRDTFRIQIVIGRYLPHEIEFVPDVSMVAAGLTQGFGIAEKLTLADWAITSIAARPETYRVVPGIEIAGYVMEFSAKRKSKFFVIKVIIPLILIVMMSWAVFWIEPLDANSQLAVAVTVMLTLIAYHFAVNDQLPDLPYLTRLDLLLLVSIVLVFFAFLEVMVTNKLANLGRIELARMIDRKSRIVFPAVFGVLSFLILT